MEEQVLDSDILCGRGRAHSLRPANKLFDALITEYAPRHEMLKPNGSMSIVSIQQAILEALPAETRFMDKYNEACNSAVQLSEQCIRRKINTAIRYLNNKQQKVQKNQRCGQQGGPSFQHAKPKSIDDSRHQEKSLLLENHRQSVLEKKRKRRRRMYGSNAVRVDRSVLQEEMRQQAQYLMAEHTIASTTLEQRPATVGTIPTQFAALKNIGCNSCNPNAARDSIPFRRHSSHGNSESLVLLLESPKTSSSLSPSSSHLLERQQSLPANWPSSPSSSLERDDELGDCNILPGTLHMPLPHADHVNKVNIGLEYTIDSDIQDHHHHHHHAAGMVQPTVGTMHAFERRDSLLLQPDTASGTDNISIGTEHQQQQHADDGPASSAEGDPSLAQRNNLYGNATSQS